MQNTRSGYKLIARYLGIFIVLIGFIVMLPLLVLPFYPEEAEYAYCFIIPGLASIVAGSLLSIALKDKENERLGHHQDSVLVVIVWVVAILISAMPYLLSGKYSFTQSVFESTSGYSTTGLSVVDVDSCPHIFLLFRSITLFVGGVGLVLILTSAISDRYGLRLYNAEGHSDKLLPNLVKSARLMLAIYGGYIIAGTIAYISFGMDVFDAINHAIASVSTGGFSTRSASIGYYDSIGIEMTTMILMLLGSTNFAIHLFLLRGKIKQVIKHCEIKFIAIALAVAIPIMAIIFQSSTGSDWGYAFRVSAFHFVSSITTTGYQTVATMAVFPDAFFYLMIVAMLVGGGLGSTAGGIKQYRIIASAKGIYHTFDDKLKHSRLISTHYIARYGNIEELTDEEARSNTGFIILYLAIFMIGTLIFCAFGYSIKDSMFEFASSLSTVGLTAGITGPSAHPVVLWTSIVGMFFGRLEILVIFTAFVKVIRDLRHKEIA